MCNCSTIVTPKKALFDVISLLGDLVIAYRTNRVVIMPENESSNPPLTLNPGFLTPPPTVETPSQGPKRKRRRIQFVNYLDDHNAHGKQRKRTRHKKFRVRPYKYSISEEDD